MKKITSIFILICLLFTPALTSSASAHDYDYVYTDVNIITPDSFESVFSATEIDRVSYTYEIAIINASNAAVAIVMELKIGSNYYQITAGDIIPSYTLPSGDVLHEGPVDGSMTVGEDEYRVTIGFAKLESTSGVMMSITIQSDYSVIAISSFGDNIIQGEVLDFFMSKVNMNSINNTDTMLNELNNNQFSDNPEDSISPLLLDPGFQPIFRPGEPEFTDLGEHDEWVYQDNCRTKHINDNGDTTIYSGALEVVYYNSSTNVMLITLRPFLNDTTSYIESLGSSFQHVKIHSMKVQLDIIETELSDLGIDYGYIAGIKMPEFEGKTEHSVIDEIIYNLFLDVLDIIKIPTNSLDAFINRLHVDATSNWGLSSSSVEITTAGLTPSDCLIFDTITPGLPFKFQLAKGNANTYEGNTQYRATSEVKYFAFTLGGTEYIGWNYYPTYCIVEGTIDIQ